MDQENNLGTPNPVVPPPQQPVSVPVPTVPPSQRKKIVILIAAIVAVLVILGIIVISMKRSDVLPNEIVPTPTQATEASTTPVVVEESFEVTLEKNKKTDINFNGIQLTFISSETPGDTCFDCISSTLVQAEVNGETSDVLYECGGIAGDCVVRQDVFGVGLELVQQIDPNTIRMKVHYKK